METTKKQPMPEKFLEAKRAWGGSFADHNRNDIVHMLRVSASILMVAGLMSASECVRIQDDLEYGRYVD